MNILLPVIYALVGSVVGCYFSTLKPKKQKDDEKENIRREKAEEILLLINELEIQIKP